jgi:Zn-dependent oligopeptidase
MSIRIIKYEKETTNKEKKMNEQQEKELAEWRNEVRFLNAVNRLDERFMANEMNQEDYDFLYEQLKKKFELV